MKSNLSVAKRMVSYAKHHKLHIPPLSLTNPMWGKGKKTLAWRVSAHAFGKQNASTQKNDRLVRLLFPPTVGGTIAAYARAEVGVHEEPAGSNYGGRVAQYQQTTGAYRAPWCGSFNAWCILHAFQKLGKIPPALAQNHAYVPNITLTIKKGLRGWKQIPFNYAQPGDTVCLWNSGHVETVLFRSGEWLHCIGGNTSPVGQNNHGGMVARTTRHRSEVTVIGRAW